MSVEAGMGTMLATIRASDVERGTRVSIDLGSSKYAVSSTDIPCAELMSVCEARCCKLSFALSTEDLDEGVIRWDYGQPYLIRQRASDGYCVHNQPDHRGCTVHAFRPRVCRAYDCRKDPRVWIDYEQRIATPLAGHLGAAAVAAQPEMFDLIDRAKAREGAMVREHIAIDHSFAEPRPRTGPAPADPADPE
jgi:Fe-S-cluster containining protein